MFNYVITICLQIVDLWDGPDGQPVVYHGHTLTGMLPVKDILNDAIKPYAFTTSPYPLFLSFENHLSEEQQVVLATQIKDTIGGKNPAITPQPLIPSYYTEYYCVIDLLCLMDVTDMEELPSPEQLRNKIVIKAKKLVHGTSPTSPEQPGAKSATVNGTDSPIPDNNSVTKVISTRF